MSYQVLARKWRPANFQQMVGQEHVLQALINALDSNRLHHAYLFSGTRGVGKTTIARIFAKSLNCEQGVGSTPCGSCSSCAEIDEGRSVDLIEIDAASRTGVDDMRELLDNVQYAPTRSRFKVYLIDEVHMLSKHSFNALLKTLEEPPPHVKFLLATTDPQKVPVTVLSRCLQFNLKRMSRAQILSQLQFLTEQESVEADAIALGQLAGAADGSMRDALSLLDQAIGYGGGTVSQEAVEAMLGSISRDYLLRLFDALLEQQPATMIAQARGVIETNPDYQRVCADMIAMLQQLALFQSDPKLADSEDYAVEVLQKYASAWSPEELQLFYQIMLHGRQDLLICPDAAAGFEMLMLRLIAFAPDAELAAQPLKKKPEPGAVDSASANADAASVVALEPSIRSTPPENVSPPPVSAKERVSGPPLAQAQPGPGIEAVVAPSPPSPGLETIAPPSPPSPGMETAESPSLPSPGVETIAPPSPPSPEVEAVAAPPPKIEVEASGDFDWSTMAYDLGLAGLSQQIVANSACLEYGDAGLRLALKPEINELVNDVIKSEIRRAIEQKLGVSLSLELTARESLPGPTPLEVRTARLERERLEAIDAIRQEPAVQKLKNAFAAELDESSVTRLDEYQS